MMACLRVPTPCASASMTMCAMRTMRVRATALGTVWPRRTRTLSSRAPPPLISQPQRGSSLLLLLLVLLLLLLLPSVLSP